jgi:hypothetical protein
MSLITPTAQIYFAIATDAGYWRIIRLLDPVSGIDHPISIRFSGAPRVRENSRYIHPMSFRDGFREPYGS